MNGPTPAIDHESRWPPALAILAVLVMLTALPDLGYNTATAFSPTDALPLTHRAKMLMLIESMISLLTMVVVLSHAINVIPS